MKIVNKLIFILSIFLAINSLNICQAMDRLPGEATFLDSNNQSINFEKFEDQVLLVHFWATWCQHCLQEMKDLDQLQKEYRKHPLKIISISEDFKGLESVQKFYEQYRIKHLEIFMDKKNELFKELKIKTIPTTWLIDKELNIVHTFEGPINWQDPINKELINNTLKNLPIK